MRRNSGLLYAACFCNCVQHIVINIIDAIALANCITCTSRISIVFHQLRGSPAILICAI